MHGFQQKQLYCIKTNYFCNFIGAEPALRELFWCAWQAEIACWQPDNVPDGICQCLWSFFLFLDCFGILQSLGDFISQFIGSWCLWNVGLDAYSWCIWACDFERGFFGGSLLLCIIGKLCEQKPVHPLMLMFSGKKLEILLEILIHTLCLPICLQVVSHRELRLNAYNNPTNNTKGTALHAECQAIAWRGSGRVRIGWLYLACHSLLG